MKGDLFSILKYLGNSIDLLIIILENDYVFYFAR